MIQKDKAKQKKSNALLVVVVVLLLLVIAVCGYRLWSGGKDYREEKRVHASLVKKYRPERAASDDPTAPTSSEDEKDTSNPAVMQLCADYPDAVGWLTIPGTDIDHPFVYSEDNRNYLHRNIDGTYLYAGTVFMDCHCSRDFTSQNTTIYGHNMNNGSMFHTLGNFKKQEVFDEYTVAYIYLPERTLTLDIFAFVITDAVTENMLYNKELQEGYLDYVKSKARYYRDPELTEEDCLVTISTCTYEYENARMVLLCKIRREGQS